MVFLLLRLLTMPTPAVPPTTTAVQAIVRQPQDDPASLRDARAQLARIEAGQAKIRNIMRVAHDSYRLSCVAQRLAEAQVHTALARDEMRALTAGDRTGGDRAHALTRLRLLDQREAEVERAAKACVDDELSTVSASKLEVEVSPAIEKRVDVTSPAPRSYPCPSTECTIMPRAP
jgi:hypothetical protein